MAGAARSVRYMAARTSRLRASTGSPATWSECSWVMRMASIEARSSPMAASRLRSSLMLSPASTRIRVFSVASRAAFPELPLASTQNLTVPASPLHFRIHPNTLKQDASEMFGRGSAGSHSGFVEALRDGDTALCSGIGAGAVEALRVGGIGSLSLSAFSRPENFAEYPVGVHQQP